MANGRILLPLLGVAMLSACSPYVYNQEITGFSSGVDAVASSYQTGQQAVDAIIAQRQQAADATARTRLILLPGCAQREPSGTPPQLPPCAAVAFGTTTPAAPTAEQKALADAAPAFAALKAYAASLAAVTNAADATALNQAAQSLTTAASGLAGAVAKLHPGAAAAGGLVQPVGGLLGQGITLYLDRRRLAALRSTVPQVDPDVGVLAETVKAALLVIRLQQLRQLDRVLLAAAEPLEAAGVAALGVAEYQSKRAALESAVAAFNLARAADPSATIAAMVDAHHQLAVALQNDTGQAAAVLTDVQSFVAAAAQLKTAITAAAAAPAAGQK